MPTTPIPKSNLMVPPLTRISYPWPNTYGAPIGVLIPAGLAVLLLIKASLTFGTIVGTFVLILITMLRIRDLFLLMTTCPISFIIQPEALDCKFLFGKHLLLDYAEIDTLEHSRFNPVLRQFSPSAKLVSHAKEIQLLLEPRSLNHFDVLVDAIFSNNSRFQADDSLLPFHQSSPMRNLLWSSSTTGQELPPAVIRTGWWTRIGRYHLMIALGGSLPLLISIVSPKLTAKPNLVILSAGLAVYALLFASWGLNRALRSSPTVISLDREGMICTFLIEGRQAFPYDHVTAIDILIQGRIWNPVLLISCVGRGQPILLWPVRDIILFLNVFYRRNPGMIHFT